MQFLVFPWPLHTLIQAQASIQLSQTKMLYSSLQWNDGSNAKNPSTDGNRHAWKEAEAMTYKLQKRAEICRDGPSFLAQD